MFKILVAVFSFFVSAASCSFDQVGTVGIAENEIYNDEVKVTVGNLEENKISLFMDKMDGSYFFDIVVFDGGEYSYLYHEIILYSSNIGDGPIFNMQGRGCRIASDNILINASVSTDSDYRALFVVVFEKKLSNKNLYVRKIFDADVFINFFEKQNDKTQFSIWKKGIGAKLGGRGGCKWSGDG